MKKFKLLQSNWSKTLSIALLMLVLSAPNVFAVGTSYTPRENINKNTPFTYHSIITLTNTVVEKIKTIGVSINKNLTASTINGNVGFLSFVGDKITSVWDSFTGTVSNIFESLFSINKIAPELSPTSSNPPITAIPPPVVSPIPTEIPTSIEIIPVPQQIIQSGLTGQMGPRGEQGPQGLTGLQGPRGETGRDGNTADTSSFVSRTFLDKQVNGIFDSIDNSTQGLSSSLSEEVITELLTVSGDATIGGNITITGNITGNVVGIINPSFTLGSIPFQGISGLSEDNANLFWDATNSRLGIGTTTPGAKLDVAGSINISSGSTYMYNGVKVITAQTALNNYFFGNSGNLTMTGDRNSATGNNAFISNTTGAGNVANGSAALRSNTTGYQNVANGAAALYDNTTGYLNTANGVNALTYNIGGYYNTADGADALYSNTTGNQNTANGYFALFSNVGGNYNTAIGSQAGYNDSPLLQTMTNSTFLGYGAKSSANGITNSMALGNGAQVTKSNQVVIGNASVTETLLRGNVGIGTTTPTAVLHLKAGTAAVNTAPLKFTSGTLLGTAEVGAIEFLTDAYYGTITTGAARKQFSFTDSAITPTTINGLLLNKGTNSISSNIALGVGALDAANSGTGSNIAIGQDALSSNTTGYYNTANGVSALWHNTTGKGNIAIGRDVLSSNTTGSYNTANGVSALYYNTSGNNNTANGMDALYSNITGSGNVAFGYYAGAYELVSNAFYLNNIDQTNTANDKAYSLLYGKFSGVAGSLTGQQLVINGKVGIGIAAPTSNLHLAAGSATAGTAPLGFTSGALLTVPVAGKVEFLTDAYYGTITTGAARKQFAFTDSNITGTSANISSGLGGQILYQSAVNTTAKLVNGTTGQVLTSAGTTLAPTWKTPVTYPITVVNTSNLFSTGLTGTGSGVTTTTYSNFLGGSAGYLATSASNSNFLGYGTGSYATSASNSNFFGQNAGAGAISASNSNFLGNSAGNAASYASYSNFIGSYAGYHATSASYSNFFGNNAGFSSSSASNSNFFGQNAGNGAANASNSIFIGQSAGNGDGVDNTLDPDDFSILIGKSTSTGTFKNSIAIGGSAINTASNQLMIGSATRPINTTVWNGTGSVTCTFTTAVGAMNCSSDINLKKNIITLNSKPFELRTNLDVLSSDTLNKILTLTPVTYNWNYESDTDPTHIGFIAQEVKQIFPDLVSQDINTKKLSLNVTGLTPYLVQAIQEMNLKVEDLSNLDTTSATSLGSLIKNFLGNVGNGVTSIYASVFNAKEKICVDGECLTKEDIKALLLLAHPPINNNGANLNPPTCESPQILENNVCVNPPEETLTCESPQILVDNICTNPTLEPEPELIPTPEPTPVPEPTPTTEPAPDPVTTL